MAFALVGCGRLFPPPVPDGEPTELPRSRTATMWTDARGGTLELKPDGTFTSADICGDYDIDAYGPKNEPRSGSGTWAGEDRKGQSSVTVSFEADDVSSAYRALRDGKKLRLWAYVGDPDDGHSLCILTQE
ncbi:hypothetical protein OHA79_24400 [Streptomyces sp. NBC_00841]|uniref:hypothetical protein n=1 Tax=unclassified Streptomyces TaxID=2593676 RepID=UPI00224DDA4B|nr:MULTISPECIES: hypothetical protein [unclassified Streptomyces]MCX4533902.1 hypothetical protein [Streptomyces sp. NBC_01669]WSA00710.1 hypothetical protein OHA79_24400 [Streptomyces sp. NBC_00841]